MFLSRNYNSYNYYTTANIHTYSDSTEIGVLQMSEDHIQKCTVVVGEII